MASKKLAKTSGTVQVRSVAVEGHEAVNSQDSSQEADVKALRAFVARQKQRVVARRRENKGKIITVHESRIRKLNDAINRTNQRQQQKIRDLRRPKVQRLMELLEEKGALEFSGQKCLENLRRAFLSTTEQLRLALEGRTQALGWSARTDDIPMAS